jgi:hypothetical protein
LYIEGTKIDDTGKQLLSVIFRLDMKNNGFKQIGGSIMDENNKPYTGGNFAFLTVMNGLIYVVPTYGVIYATKINLLD